MEDQEWTEAGDRSRPILLGEGRGGDRFYHFPLYGRWTWALYERFECRNLFERYAQAEPWSVPRARERAREIERDLDGRVVVCLGRRVQATVYDALDIPREYAQVFHSWVTNAVVQVVAIPHPSGLNRALNHPVERERCSETLRVALAGGWEATRSAS